MERDTMTGKSELAEELDRHVKTYKSRIPNWGVFGFETQKDEKFARAQRRYLGTSGNVEHNDPTALMGDHFTLTIIMQPAGNKQPMHCHDEEEVFFVLTGNPTVIWEGADGETIERRLSPWDMVYNPPGRIHGVINDSDEDAFFQIMLGNPSPARPQYQDSELRQLQAVHRPDEGARQA